MKFGVIFGCSLKRPLLHSTPDEATKQCPGNEDMHHCELVASLWHVPKALEAYCNWYVIDKF